MTTKAGEWPPLALSAMTRLYRARALSSADYVYQLQRGRKPARAYNAAMRETYDRMFHEVLPVEKSAKGDHLERIGHALVRIILKTADHPDLKALLQLSWHSAYTLDKWHLNDPEGALAELRRYALTDAAGKPVTGPRQTRELYRTALAGRATSTLLTMNTSAKHFRNDHDATAITSRYRLRPDRLISDAVNQIAAPNGRSELQQKIDLFVANGHGLLIGCAIAGHIEFHDLKTGRQWSAEQWRILSEHVNQEPIVNSITHSVAAHLLERRMIDDAGAIKVVQRIADYHRDARNAQGTRNMFRQLPTIVDQRLLRPDIAAWKAHPVWGRQTRRGAAEVGYNLAKNDFAKWLDCTNEFGDPDNHPLNFMTYEMHYGRAFGNPYQLRWED